MANFDGTGPNGRGPFTGRGFGSCGRGVRGSGRGFGYRRVSLTNEERKKILSEELKEIELERKEIEKEIKELNQ